jgi:hypothetical protein
VEEERHRRETGAVIPVIVVGEGQTEEAFVRDVLAPTLAVQGIYLWPQLIATSSSSKGGALNLPRVLRSLRNTLRQRPDTYVTTFFDLYRLDGGFPGFAEAARLRDPLRRAETLEARLNTAVVEESGCRPDRFFAHVQPHEFEGLLFSDVGALLSIEPAWQPFENELSQACGEVESP